MIFNRRYPYTLSITLDQYPIRIYEIFDALFYDSKPTDYIPSISLLGKGEFDKAFIELRKLVLERKGLGVGVKKSWIGVTVGGLPEKVFPGKKTNNYSYFIANLLHKYKDSRLNNKFYILDSNEVSDLRKQAKRCYPKYITINTTKEISCEIANTIIRERLLDVPNLFDDRGSWINFRYSYRYFANYLGCFLMYYDKIFQNLKPAFSYTL